MIFHVPVNVELLLIAKLAVCTLCVQYTLFSYCLL